MKHEYAADELRELKSIYDESGEAGLSRDEMRALRKAGLVTQDLPPEPEKREDTLAGYQAVSKPTAEPSKRDCILAHCQNRIDQGQTFDGKETAEALNLSQKTVGNIISQLRKEGLLPAFDKHSPRKTTRKTTTTGKRKETMTTTSKPAANKEEPMSQGITANKETAPEKQCENPCAIISNALTGIFDSISALQ
ncbi:molecular chaperone GrpE [Bifidobacterium adolescentis]|uniref:molecular chaperone GrpE n=1 Tax=Bifidobacterium adolescentis TaxID=1680 RepID=UPI0032C192C5